MARYRTSDGVFVNIDDATAAAVASGWELIASTPAKTEPAVTDTQAEDQADPVADEAPAKTEPAKRRPGRPKKEASDGSVS